MDDTHATSIAAFMVEDKFFVIGADSRRCSFTNYGTVYGGDNWIKIHHICGKFYGAGSGSFNLVENVFNEARKLWKDNLPTEVEQVADSIATLAQEKMNLTLHTSFVVGGWIAGKCEMYSVTLQIKDPVAREEDTFTAAERSEQTKDGDEEDEILLGSGDGIEQTKDGDEEDEILLGSGDGIDTAAERKSEKRKVPDAAKIEYEYKPTKVTEVLSGSGRRLMLETLHGDKRRDKTYPFTSSTTIEEAKNLIRELMRNPLNHDFCSDGMLRVVSVSEEGMVGLSSAEVVDPGNDQDKYYGDWVEGNFVPVGQSA